MTDEIIAALARIPLFGPKRAGRAQAVRLTGGTINQVYRIELDGHLFTLRLPKGPAPYPGYYSEENRNMRLAASWGVAPRVLYFDIADGLLLYGFVPGTMLESSSLGDAAALSRLLSALRRVHRGSGFLYTHDPFPRIDSRRDRFKPAMPPRVAAGLDRLFQALEPARAILTSEPKRLVPCHNDPFPQNYIDTGRQMVLIDWQASGMSVAEHELAGLCNHARLAPRQEEEMARLYGNGILDPRLLARIRLYRPVSSLFHLLGHARDTLTGDDPAAAKRQLSARLHECGTLLKGESFAWALKTLGREGKD